MGVCYANKNYCLFAAILLDINSQRAVVVVMKSIATKRQVCLTLLEKEAIFLIVVLLVKTAKDQRRLSNRCLHAGPDYLPFDQSRIAAYSPVSKYQNALCSAQHRCPPPVSVICIISAPSGKNITDYQRDLLKMRADHATSVAKPNRSFGPTRALVT